MSKEQLQCCECKWWKQLDQLKAENDELKKQLMQKDEVDMFFNTSIEGWSSDPCGICPHKAENERLQEEREKAKNYNLEYGQLLIKATNENHELKSDNKHLNDLLNQALKDYEKALQTLTEIKKIVSSTLDCGEWIGQGDNKMEQVLNKISEVE